MALKKPASKKPSAKGAPAKKKLPAKKPTAKKLAKKSGGKAASRPAQADRHEPVIRPSADPTVLAPEILPAESLSKSTVKKPVAKKPPRAIDYNDLHEDAEVIEAEDEDIDSEDAGDESDGPEDSEETGTGLVTQDAAAIDRELTTAGRAISPTDPLRRYLDEVRRYPLLTPEEEVALAAKLHATGDIDAAKRLVQANLRLVVKIAFEYKSVYANVMDLIQEGNVGLMKAVSKYDPTKGARVGYYSSWWIRSYILKYLLDNFRLVRVGTTAAQKKLFFHLMREKERLEAQGILAAPKLLADKLHVREKDVVEMEKRLGSHGGEVSLDSPVSPHGEGKSSYVELLEDEREGADEKLAQEQLIELVKERIPEFEKTLNDRERRLLKDRLLSEEPKTLQEVADHYGLTRERARQIEAGVIAKLKDFLKESLR